MGERHRYVMPLQVLRVLPAMVILMTGCSQESALCTALGGAPTITLEFSDVRAAHPRQALIARGCASDVCETVRLQSSNPRPAFMHLDASSVDDSTPLPMTLRITNASGKELFEGHLNAVPKKRQPNGPGCPPTTWAVSLHASVDGGLRQADRPEQ